MMIFPQKQTMKTLIIQIINNIFIVKHKKITHCNKMGNLYVLSCGY